MFNVSTLIRFGPGRIATTASAPTRYAPGPVPMNNAGRVCLQTGGSILFHVAGLPFASGGRLCGAMTNTMQIRNFVGGLPLTVNGRLATSDIGAIHHYVRGLPVTVDGRLCIGAPDAPLE